VTLDDEGVVTFLQHCAAVGAPVFVHPWDLPDSPRLRRWMAQWLVGMPAETHLLDPGLGVVAPTGRVAQG
jgi:aminocarboxymuconate-semialdehyde decarboxylase